MIDIASDAVVIARCAFGQECVEAWSDPLAAARAAQSRRATRMRFSRVADGFRLGA